MLFTSYYAALMVIVRPESIQYHPATGVEIGRVPFLTANFGRHLGEYTTQDYLTGGVHEGAQIQGHFFDSEVAQEELGWTDEERESVEMTILRIAREQPYLVREVVLTVPPAERPWPSYDEQTAKEIVAISVSAGLVDAALNYERENKNRSTLITELEQAQEAHRARVEQTETRREPAEITL